MFACLHVCVSIHSSIHPYVHQSIVNIKIVNSQQPEELKTWFKHQKWSPDVAKSNGVDYWHPDQHKDDQEGQEHPPSTMMSLMALLHHWPCVIIFWKPWVKSTSLIATVGIMITIRMNRKLRNILQVERWPWWLFCTNDPMCCIFVQTWGQIQFNSRYHDHHQYDQESEGHPASRRMSLMTISHNWSNV